MKSWYNFFYEKGENPVSKYYYCAAGISDCDDLGFDTTAPAWRDNNDPAHIVMDGSECADGEDVSEAESSTEAESLEEPDNDTLITASRFILFGDSKDGQEEFRRLTVRP